MQIWVVLHSFSSFSSNKDYWTAKRQIMWRSYSMYWIILEAYLHRTRYISDVGGSKVELRPRAWIIFLHLHIYGVKFDWTMQHFFLTSKVHSCFLVQFSKSTFPWKSQKLWVLCGLPGLFCHKGLETVCHWGNGSFLHAWEFPWRWSEQKANLFAQTWQQTLGTVWMKRKRE